MLESESKDQITRGSNTMREAELIVEEAKELSINAGKQIEEGNMLVEAAQQDTNSTLKSIKDYRPEEFKTEEVELNNLEKPSQTTSETPQVEEE